MAWVRIDDRFDEHPKVMAAGHEAMWLLLRALAFANRGETDGHIPAVALSRIGSDFGPTKRKTLMGTLVEVELLHCPGHVCARCPQPADGWQIHDYADYQPSREELDQKRMLARRRAAMNSDPDLAKEIRDRDGSNCRYCGRRVDWRDRKSPKGGTYDHVIPIHQGGDESVENLVVACRRCNSKKGAKTPDQAGMPLRPPLNRTDIKTESSGSQAETRTASGQPVPVPGPVPEPQDAGSGSSGDHGKGGFQGGAAGYEQTLRTVAEELADRRQAEGYTIRNREGFVRDQMKSPEVRNEAMKRTPTPPNVRRLIDGIGKPIDGEEATG